MGDLVEWPGRTARRPTDREARPERPWREALGRELRAERSRRGERIHDVAKRSHVSPQYLSEVERGKKDPSSEVLAAVARALDLPVAELARRASGRLRADARAQGLPAVWAGLPGWWDTPVLRGQRQAASPSYDGGTRLPRAA